MEKAQQKLDFFDSLRRFFPVGKKRLRPSRNPSFVSDKTGVLNIFWPKYEDL